MNLSAAIESGLACEEQLLSPKGKCTEVLSHNSWALPNPRLRLVEITNFGAGCVLAIHMVACAVRLEVISG